MPHLTVHAYEADLAGREANLIAALTDAVVAVYGGWAREIAEVQLIGLPAGRWGVGGRPAPQRAPRVTFGIREGAFHHPDAARIVTGLIAGVTDAVATVCGEHLRAGVTVDLVGAPDGRTGVGGHVVTY